MPGGHRSLSSCRTWSSFGICGSILGRGGLVLVMCLGGPGSCSFWEMSDEMKVHVERERRLEVLCHGCFDGNLSCVVST